METPTAAPHTPHERIGGGRTTKLACLILVLSPWQQRENGRHARTSARAVMPRARAQSYHILAIRAFRTLYLVLTLRIQLLDGVRGTPLQWAGSVVAVVFFCHFFDGPLSWVPRPRMEDCNTMTRTGGPPPVRLARRLRVFNYVCTSLTAEWRRPDDKAGQYIGPLPLVGWSLLENNSLRCEWLYRLSTIDSPPRTAAVSVRSCCRPPANGLLLGDCKILMILHLRQRQERLTYSNGSHSYWGEEVARRAGLKRLSVLTEPTRPSHDTRH